MDGPLHSDMKLSGMAPRAAEEDVATASKASALSRTFWKVSLHSPPISTLSNEQAVFAAATDYQHRERAKRLSRNIATDTVKRQ